MEVLISKDIIRRRRIEPMDLGNPHFRILLVEDIKTDAEIIIKTIKKYGLKFESRCVDNFEDFKNALSNFEPSIVLADYVLPGFRGLEALNYLKENKIEIPFILVTASQSEETAVECLKEGVDDYIVKSNLVRLAPAIVRAIEQKNIERQKMEAEVQLIHYKEIYEIFIEAQSKANTGFLIIDSTSEQPLYVNESFCDFTGYSISEILELKKLSDIIKPEMKNNFRHKIGEIKIDKNYTPTFDTVFVHQNGQFVNVEFTSGHTYKDGKSCIVLIGRDTTVKRKSELLQRAILAALQESELKFRTLVEDVKDYAMFLLDLEGKIISWNVGAERLLGYMKDEIIMKSYALFLPKNSDKSFSAKEILNKTKETGRSEIETWIIVKNKKRFWGTLTITTVLNKDRSLNYYSIIIHDLTKIKKAGDQLMEQKKQLRSLARSLQATREEERIRIARELHDEFGQLLTALRMDLTILGRMISKSVSDSLTRISLLEKTSSISDLLETIIRSTRKIITELRPAVLDELGLITAIQWQAQEFEGRTGIRCQITRLQHGITISQEKSTAIFRILQEALTNVSKHSQARKVIVSFYTREDKLILEISDNGKGIETNKLNDPTSSGIVGIRERVIALDGSFNIYSEKNKGTDLRISIPYLKD